MSKCERTGMMVIEMWTGVYSIPRGRWVRMQHIPHMECIRCLSIIPCDKSVLENFNVIAFLVIPHTSQMNRSIMQLSRGFPLFSQMAFGYAFENMAIKGCQKSTGNCHFREALVEKTSKRKGVH
jgi:hypothetical protein